MSKETVKAQLDLELIKQQIKALTEKKNELEDERRQIKFELDKAETQVQELEPKILELFGTTDLTKLETKLSELSIEAQQILDEIESINDIDSIEELE